MAALPVPQMYKIAMITEPSFEDILEFLRENFFPFEPCAKALDLCPHGYRIPALEAQLVTILRHKLSLAAFLPENKEIIGVVLLDIKTPLEDCVHTSDDAHCACSRLPERFLKLEHLFDDICTNGGRDDVFHSLNLNRLLDIYIVCTSPRMAQMGVGSALIEEALKLARKHRFEAVQCMALSAFTQRICKKFNFSTLFSVTYATYEQRGERLFAKAAMGDHKEGCLMVKRL